MKAKYYLIVCATLLVAFLALWCCVVFVDVQRVGANDTTLGLASVNLAVFLLLGQDATWDYVTDWLTVVCILVGASVGAKAFFQAVMRKSVKKVDTELYVVLGCYLLALAFVALFEIVPVNYRPLLAQGNLQASFPSTHALICIVSVGETLFTATFRKCRKPLQLTICALFALCCVAVCLGRLLAGAHWLTDVVASVLLGGAIVALCGFLCQKVVKN